MKSTAKINGQTKGEILAVGNKKTGEIRKIDNVFDPKENSISDQLAQKLQTYGFEEHDIPMDQNMKGH